MSAQMESRLEAQAAAAVQMDEQRTDTGSETQRETAAPPKRKAFSRYFAHLNLLIRTPRQFYSEVASEEGYSEALTFLVTSSVFFTMVSYTYLFNSDLRMIPVILLNSIGMPFLAAGMAWMTMVMFFGRQEGGYARVFSIFAYAAGTVMLISWIPALGWATEIWRLLLVGVGIQRVYSLGWKKTFFVVVASTVVLTMFFWSSAPIISSLKSLF